MDAETTTSVRIGNAPVSYGAYGEVAVEVDPARFLELLARDAYSGSELGDPSFFGAPAQTARLFQDAGLTAIGAFAAIRTTMGADLVADDLERLGGTCAQLLAANPEGMVILADEGPEEMFLRPGRVFTDHPDGLDAASWDTLVGAVTRAAAVVRAEGLAVSFHPHTSTWVESPADIDRLLADTDLDLTFDTGHVLLGGGDPVADLRRWSDRIAHIHVKDVLLDRQLDGLRSGRRDPEQWWSEVVVPLGAGDVDLDGVVEELARMNYAGWLVIEQDRLPATPAEIEDIARQQHANRRVLETALAGRITVQRQHVH